MLFVVGCNEKPNNITQPNINEDKSHNNLNDDLLLFSGSLIGNELDIVVTNRGTSDIVVDRNLVFFLQINVYDGNDQQIVFEHGIETLDKVIVDREYVLRPGERITRHINFNKSFVILTHVTGTFFEQNHTFSKTYAYEQSQVLPPNTTISKVELEYGHESHDHWTTVHLYLGVFPESLKFYTKYHKIVIKQSGHKRID
jgi:hypothetical protein